MFLRLLQPLKAFFPIEVREDGILIDDKFLQLRKASFPIEVTDEGRLIDDRFWQS